MPLLVVGGAGPSALGALADASSTHLAFLVVPGLLLVAVVLLLASTRMAATCWRHPVISR